MTTQAGAEVDRAVDETARRICVRMFDAIAHGELSDFEALVHPDAFNREARTQPPENRPRGPQGFYATALWLRSALSDMSWDVNEVVADNDLIAVHTTAHGRHVGPFAFYDPDGTVERVFPPTGKTCSVTQTHWFRLADGQVIEHWANRDDMGTARQLGWIPPSPRYLVRMAFATRKARRHPNPTLRREAPH
jgi:predicted ester cyclase